MAYLPTLEQYDKDIEKEKTGYIPTLEEHDAPLPQKSLMEKLKDIGSSVLHGTERAAKIPINIGSAAAQYGVDTGEWLANLPNFLSGGRIPKFGAHFDVPLYNPEAIEGRYTPAALTGISLGSSLAALPGLGRFALAGVNKIPGVASAIEKYGVSSAEKGKDFIRNLLNGNRVDEAHKSILGELRSNYKSNLQNSNEEYGLIKKIANDRDYHGQSKLSRALGERNGKSIDATSTLQDIDKLESNDKTLNDLVNKFKEKPSFDLAHRLQSRLGSEGSYLRTSSDSVQRQLGGKYLDARRDLISDIQKSFSKNKDTDLGDLYKKATSNFKENVVPYQKNRTINQVVTKRDLDEVNPENIHNTLAKDDEAVQKIVGDLSNNTKDLILAKKLAPVINQTERSGLQVDPKKLLDKLSEVKSGKFNKFLSPENRNLIRDLEDRLEFERKYIGPVKKGMKYAGLTGLGAAGLGGVYKAKKEIFE